jgi:hypothetical protein
MNSTSWPVFLPRNFLRSASLPISLSPRPKFAVLAECPFFPIVAQVLSARIRSHEDATRCRNARQQLQRRSERRFHPWPSG